MRIIYHTITLGDPDTPFAQGGRGPDEPTWYFDDADQYEQALNELVGYNLKFTLDTVTSLPEGESPSTAGEFTAYLDFVVAP